eukprot:590111-Rhodomonas_salina.2
MQITPLLSSYQVHFRIGRVSADAAARQPSVLTQSMVLPEGSACLMGTGSHGVGPEVNLKGPRPRPRRRAQA